MANYCARCGTPLPIGSESDYCIEHGGPPLSPDATIRCPYCSEAILATAKKCKHCGEFLDGSRKTNVAPTPPAPAPQLPRELKAKSGVMDGVKIGCGMFIVLPLLIILALIVLAGIFKGIVGH